MFRYSLKLHDSYEREKGKIEIKDFELTHFWLAFLVTRRQRPGLECYHLIHDVLS